MAQPAGWPRRVKRAGHKGVRMGHNGPNNIGTHPGDVPRSLNADMGGEGSPTDRLWHRYRTELAERPSHSSGDMAQRRSDSVEREDDRDRVERRRDASSAHGLLPWLKRLVGAPV